MNWTPKIPDSSPARTSNSIKLEIFSSEKHLFLDNSVSACCLSAKLPDHGLLVYVFFIKSAFSFFTADYSIPTFSGIRLFEKGIQLFFI